MHVVVVGCGRVGSSLARTLSEGGHTVAIIDKRPEAFARLPANFPGQAIGGIGFDRDRLRQAGIEEAGALGRSHERGQLQHRDRPRRPRDVRSRERGGPHLRPPAGRDLPAPGHRHGGHGGVDDGAGPAADPARPSVGRVDRPQRPGDPRRAHDLLQLGRSPGQRLGRAGRDPSRGRGPARGRSGAQARSRHPGGRRALPHRGRRRARNPGRQAGRLGRREATDARRDRRRRQRRPLHRRAAAARRPRGDDPRQRPRGGPPGVRIGRAGRCRVARGRRLRGQPAG